MKPDSPLVFGIRLLPPARISARVTQAPMMGELEKRLPSVVAFNMEDRTSYQVRFIFPLLGACLLGSISLSWHQTNCETANKGVTVLTSTDPPGHVSRAWAGWPWFWPSFARSQPPRKDSTGNIPALLSSRILGCCEPHCHPCARLGLD